MMIIFPNWRDLRDMEGMWNHRQGISLVLKNSDERRELESVSILEHRQELNILWLDGLKDY